jgi:hypothetical protein
MGKGVTRSGSEDHDEIEKQDNGKVPKGASDRAYHGVQYLRLDLS